MKKIMDNPDNARRLKQQRCACCVHKDVCKNIDAYVHMDWIIVSGCRYFTQTIEEDPVAPGDPINPP